MKRTVLIEVFLLFILSILLVFVVLCIRSSVLNFLAIKGAPTSLKYDLLEAGYRSLTYGILALVAALADIAAIVLIALKEFPVFKPLVEKMQARKERRKQLKAERDEEKRKARIEQLQSELNDLKKDE